MSTGVPVALLWALLTDRRTTPDERRALTRMRHHGVPAQKRAWVLGIANRLGLTR